MRIQDGSANGLITGKTALVKEITLQAWATLEWHSRSTSNRVQRGTDCTNVSWLLMTSVYLFCISCIFKYFHNVVSPVPPEFCHHWHSQKLSCLQHHRNLPRPNSKPRRVDLPQTLAQTWSCTLIKVTQIEGYKGVERCAKRCKLECLAFLNESFTEGVGRD